MKLRLLILSPLLCLHLWAGVVRLDVVDRQDVEGGRQFGAVGSYQRITGKALFTVDPKLPENQGVVDIALAPRNEAGLVEFAADVYILKPTDPVETHRSCQRQWNRVV